MSKLKLTRKKKIAKREIEREKTVDLEIETHSATDRK